ncbi:thiamine ABC transporter permease [Enterovibrio sp. ZSDZ42]|uniref:Thiamine ABC transporter permease n=1 Tax=Enterovibrio gelatinilyticus TaxID=2899819 RepID=A0ABT5QYF2_9GAMM|nr:thiamine ABC transporter permease [Enterovibrio sp. ZSDZ42]MDD1793041.1 thiamine ABC transporter permease [Enterovibrio sp. ZSDZ42]
MLRLLYVMTLTVCCLPLIPGLGGVLLSATSYLPVLGLTEPNLDGWRAMLAWPGSLNALQLSVVSGVTATLLAVTITFLILQRCWGTRGWNRIEKWLSPLLAMPHVAFAIGFALTFAPSGWLFRFFALFTQESTPYTWSLVQDSNGFGLIIALAIKETPFLLLMSLSVLRQMQVDRLLAASQSLGYNRSAAWLKVVLPQWLPKMRFPIYAVLAYGLSVVDVAMILGPSTPSTFAVLVWQWFNDPDLLELPRAAAGAITLFILCFGVLSVYRLFEYVLICRWQNWQFSGSKAFNLPGKHWFKLIAIVPFLMIPVLLVWSFALRWRFPDIWPSRLSMRFWEQESSNLLELAANSLILGLVSATVALIFSIGCLEHRDRYHKSLPQLVIAIPMLIPQLSILFGIQIAIYMLPGQWHVPATIWAHILFAFPYVYLALDGPWRSFDQRLTQTARSLGQSATKAWWSVKLPIVLPAILLAWAVGLSVSFSQYLPTQLLGAGRITTLTTEAVSLASGQDRRISAVYGLIQAFLPLVFFCFALAASRFADPRRRIAKRAPKREIMNEFVRTKPDYKV